MKAATEATKTIPIVMVAVDYDPLALGYVAGLARPGGNITGVFLRQTELSGRRLDLLKQTIPASLALLSSGMQRRPTSLKP
jgi:putative ABC transport system substrate-binding protein